MEYNALTRPYHTFGKLVFTTLLLFFVRLFTVAAVSLDFTGYYGASLSPAVVVCLQLLLFAASFVLSLAVFGYLSTMFKVHMVSPSWEMGSSLRSGLRLWGVFFIYTIVYGATLYIPGGEGELVSIMYALFLIVFLPGILTLASQKDSFLMGFKLHHIARHIFRRQYVKAYGQAILIAAAYGIVGLVLSVGMYAATLSEGALVITYHLYYFALLFLAMSALSTIATVFGESLIAHAPRGHLRHKPGPKKKAKKKRK